MEKSFLYIKFSLPLKYDHVKEKIYIRKTSNLARLSVNFDFD
jgi:hypothetical protein